MIAAYLWLNAVLYLGLGILCAARVESIARKLGFVTLDDSGRCEFTAVYGGMEIGLGAFFAWCAFEPLRHGTGLVFALCFYGGIVLLRVPALLRYRVSSFTRQLAIGEIVLLIAAIALYFAGR